MADIYVWLLLVACSALGVAWALRTPLFRAYYDDHHDWREEPREFLWASVNATLLGLGTGMLVWFSIVVIVKTIDKLVG